MKSAKFNTGSGNRPLPLPIKMTAPCGINCARCMAHMRVKDPCPGCGLRNSRTDSSKAYRRCVIRRCRKRSGRYCDSCPDLPCARLKQLDRRYRTRYATGLIDNLLFIKKSGIRAFLRRERAEATCRSCGALLSIHRSECLQCGASWRSAT
ncbi:MAG: DUF3795 domain-containing protein [Spirochaetales bacterium]|nr:DUF3795 domain-containing protein [Spirochaetales bacterium]